MIEVYCIAGKQTVFLPDGASEGFDGITISPCSGCQHKYHQQQLTEIEGEIQAAAQVNLAAVRKYTHNVTVIPAQKGDTVICECNCTVVFPNWRKNLIFNTTSRSDLVG